MTIQVQAGEYTKAKVSAGTITGVDSDLSAVPKVLFLMMADDIGRSQMPQYADLSQWPAAMPFPSMPFLDSIKATEGMRFTNARVNARCSPTRASMLTGRLAHITSPNIPVGHAGHPDGTGVGDTHNNTPAGQVPFSLGLQSEHNPWAKVLGDMGTPHAKLTGPKYHLFERTADGDANVVNRRGPIDEAGFDHAIQSSLAGSGEPDYGYFGYSWWETFPDSGDDTSGTGNPVFNPTWTYERLIAWLDSQLGSIAPKPIVVNWWMHLPHGNPPSFPQNSGVDGEQCHTTYTEAQLVPNTISADGQVAPGDDRWGHDALGVEDGVGAYTSEGAVHIFWRRTVALYETMDYFAQKIHDYVKENYLAAYRQSLWMHYSDNGSDPGALEPVASTEFADLGPEFAATFPPTFGVGQGTISGERYHDPDDAKGSILDEGILTHLLVWGPQLPDARKGTDCAAPVGPCDFYPTILEYLTGDAWEAELGATELAKLDGESFLPRILDGAIGTKIYTYHAVQQPGWVQDENAHVHQFDRCVVKTTATEKWKWRSIFEQEYDNGGAGGAIIIPKSYHLYNLLTDPTEQTDLRPFDGDEGYEDVTAAVAELSLVYLAMFGTS
jgi:arylsulfatase A-like enzyme